MDKYVAILGSDSEEEMSTKPDYIDALKMVHQLDGLNSLVIPKNYFFLISRNNYLKPAGLTTICTKL